jgi:Transposase
VQQQGNIGSSRLELDAWIKALPQPRMIAMEATIFIGWIYDHLLLHAEKVKVAHPLMLRAIAAAKRKNDRIDAAKIADCLRCDFLPECHMAATPIRDRRRVLRYRNLMQRQAVQMKNRISGLVEATRLAPRYSPELAVLYERGRQRGNANRTTLAVARKMVAHLLTVDRRKTDFVPAPALKQTAAA